MTGPGRPRLLLWLGAVGTAAGGAISVVLLPLVGTGPGTGAVAAHALHAGSLGLSARLLLSVSLPLLVLGLWPRGWAARALAVFGGASLYSSLYATPSLLLFGLSGGVLALACVQPRLPKSPGWLAPTALVALALAFVVAAQPGPPPALQPPPPAPSPAAGTPAPAPSVVVQPDRFSWKGRVEGYTKEENYFPAFRAGAAALQVRQDPSAGNLRVGVMDGAAAWVMQMTPVTGDLLERATLPGNAGAWMVILDFRGYTGEAEVRMEPAG